MAGKKKQTKPAPEKGPVMNKGVIAGIVILGIAIVVFAFFMLANPAPTEPGCEGPGGTCTVPSLTTATPTQVPLVKTARPTVELYVMSFCPFGVQVEKVMMPVVALLGNSTDFRVLYIATVPGSDLSTAKSLHGNNEAIEDARQLCVMKHAPEKYWEYLRTFNTQCYPVWTNTTQLVACQQNVTANLGISATVTQCVSGSEGFELLKVDSAAVRNAGITASPTILINGQKFSGSRTPESIKQAICDHFDVAPDACATVLSSETVSASGSC